VSSAAFADWLASTSLWAIAVALLLAMVAAAVAGYFVRKWRLRRRGPLDPEKENHEGFVLSAVLGLLALLLGFTFALAVDRFETRRALVLEEANAIGTAYLRTQLLEEPHRARISRLLVEYTDNRIVVARAPPAEARTLVARNDRLVTELWAGTIAAFPTIRGIDFSSAYLDSMNLVIDLDESRKASRQAKVPHEVYLVLFIYIVVAAGVMGFTLDGPLERGAATFLFLLLTLSLMLIIDIDRPTGGGIDESQRPMEDLQASLRVWQAGAFDAPPASGR
jgi:hypothetical protein